MIRMGAVALCNGVRIVENENGNFKANIMLAKVWPVLGLVSFKAHGRVTAKNTASN
jgi:hypothetical protein